RQLARTRKATVRAPPPRMQLEDLVDRLGHGERPVTAVTLRLTRKQCAAGMRLPSPLRTAAIAEQTAEEPPVTAEPVWQTVARAQQEATEIPRRQRRPRLPASRLVRDRLDQ